MKHTVSRTVARRPKALSARDERGTAMLIAIMILALMAVFVASTLHRVTGESVTMGNDEANTLAYNTAQASLERMTRNFDKLFDVSPSPSPAAITVVQNDLPNIPGYDITQTITDVTTVTEQVAIPDGPYGGLVALRDRWRLDSTVKASSGRTATVKLTRTLNNYLIPIFQFGIFYDDDMEFHPGPRFDFGGRVHSNRHIYMMASTGCYFRNRVTAVGEVVTDVGHNGTDASNWGNNVFVYNGSTYQKVTQGSVTGGPDIAGTDPLQPNGTSAASSWATFKTRFNGNLVAGAPRLQLPLQIGTGLSPLELVRRGTSSDTGIVAASRYYNKPGIRVTLSDTQGQLPGGTGGRRLDGDSNGLGASSTADRGYWPIARVGATPPPRATRINGNRLYTGPTGARAHWIKVEIVNQDTATLAVTTTDITEDFLSLGMTKYDSDLGLGDQDAIIQLQRFSIPGPPVKVTQGTVHSTSTTTAAYSTVTDVTRTPNTLPIYSYVTPGTAMARTVVTPRTIVVATSAVTNVNAYMPQWNGTASLAEAAHEKSVIAAGIDTRYVPFPIMMFDTREGLYNDSLANTGTTSWDSLYNNTTVATNVSRVPVNGVLSCIDVDLTNFRRFVNGAFNGTFPGGLVPSSVPTNDGHGWILYVSDRRGDADNDGYWDMENVVVANATDTTSASYDAYEDANHNGTVETDYTNEGATYDVAIPSDMAALTDTKYFRRCTRLVGSPGTELEFAL